MKLNTEPVAWAAALLALFGGVIALLNVFEVTHWTPDQTAAVTTVASLAIAFILTVFVRSAVTPVASPTIPGATVVPDTSTVVAPK